MLYCTYAEHARWCFRQPSSHGSTAVVAAAASAAVAGTYSSQPCSCMRVAERYMFTISCFALSNTLACMSPCATVQPQLWKSIRTQQLARMHTHHVIHSQTSALNHYNSNDSFRVELDGLRQRLSSCKTVHDLFLLTEKAAYIAKTAAAACRKRAADKEPVSYNLLLVGCTGWLHVEGAAGSLTQLLITTAHQAPLAEPSRALHA